MTESKNYVFWTVFLLVFAAAGSELCAEVRFSSLFSDSAVIQRDRPILLWGEGSPGENVVVTLAGEKVNVQSETVQTDKKGIWSAALGPLSAGGPYELTVRGDKGGGNKKTLHDIYIGDLWLCIGANRMGRTAPKEAFSIEEASPDTASPVLHILPLEPVFAEKPKKTIFSAWKTVDPQNRDQFSAESAAFGLKLAQKTGIPIGVITAACDDSTAEAWTDPSRFEEIPLLETLAEPDRNEQKIEPQRSGLLWNGTLSPLTRLAVRGIVYDSGEVNIGRAYQFRTLFPAMIGQWRRSWRLGDIPVYYAQLGSFDTERDGTTESAAAQFREAQQAAQGLRRVCGSVTIDLNGETAPVRVGERLAALVLWDEYQSGNLGTGPKLRSCSLEPDRAVLTFDFTGGGLEFADETETGLAIAGEDGKFFPAEGEIEGDRVFVTSKFVAHPAAVRYQWGDREIGGLRNTEGFPAEPFRTDDKPGITEYNR